jgi:hypothetical protein
VVSVVDVREEANVADCDDVGVRLCHSLATGAGDVDDALRARVLVHIARRHIGVVRGAVYLHARAVLYECARERDGRGGWFGQAGVDCESVCVEHVGCRASVGCDRHLRRVRR